MAWGSWTCINSQASKAPYVITSSSPQGLTNHFRCQPQPLEGGPVPAATVTEASKRRGKKSANFVCPIPECRSAFNKREELKGALTCLLSVNWPRPTIAGHIYSHSGEKAFKCMWPGCGKGFTRNNTLIRHETVHFGHIPLVCEGCGKSFTRKDNLRQHCKRFLHFTQRVLSLLFSSALKQRTGLSEGSRSPENGFWHIDCVMTLPNEVSIFDDHH